MKFLININDINPHTSENTQVKFVTDILKETGRVLAISGDLFLFEVDLQRLMRVNPINFFEVHARRMADFLDGFRSLLGIYGPIVCLPENRNQAAFSVIDNASADPVTVSKMYDAYIEYYEKCPQINPEITYPNEVFVNNLKNNRPMIVTSVPDGLYE